VLRVRSVTSSTPATTDSCLKNLGAALAFLRLPPTEPELRLLQRPLLHGREPEAGAGRLRRGADDAMASRPAGGVGGGEEERDADGVTLAVI
jgi:hypothetical protein